MSDVVRSRLASLAPDLSPRRVLHADSLLGDTALSGTTALAGKTALAGDAVLRSDAALAKSAAPIDSRGHRRPAAFPDEHPRSATSPDEAERCVEAEPTWPGEESEPATAPLGGRVREFGRAHIGVLLVVGLVALIWAAWTVLGARTQVVEAFAPVPELLTPGPTVGAVPDSASPTPESVSEPTIVVHVIGAVAQPGVVSLQAGARVGDAVGAAGGFTERARPGDLNLAEVLADGVQIKVGDVADPGGEVRGLASGGGAPATPGGESAEGAGLDLNSASVTQLESLPGVGPVTAAAIVAWRTKHQRFSKVEELQEIDGIGPKTYARLAPHVRV